jgi:hypothetical protein
MEGKVGKLRDQLIREAEEDNRKTVGELVSNDLDGNHLGGGFSKAIKEVNARDSRNRMDRARDLIRSNPEILFRVGLDLNHRLMEAVPGLGPSECQCVVSEFFPNQPKPPAP